MSLRPLVASEIPKTFLYDLMLPERLPLKHGHIVALGAVVPACGEQTPVGSSAGGSALRLGLRIYAKDNPQKILFEDRVRFERDVLVPNVENNFHISFPFAVCDIGSTIGIVFDFVVEEKYWFASFSKTTCIVFAEKSSDGFAIINAPRNQSAHEEAKNGALPSSASSGTDLVASLASSLDRIRKRYGPMIAVEFAYAYILARRADSFGLTDKIKQLESGTADFSAICAEMFGSDEYRARGNVLHRTPNIEIDGWGLLRA